MEVGQTGLFMGPWEGGGGGGWDEVVLLLLLLLSLLGKKTSLAKRW